MASDTCTCETLSLTSEGLCSKCKKIVPWSKLKDSSNSEVQSLDSTYIAQTSAKRGESLQSQLDRAIEKVIRIASIFDRIGTVLNGINYGLAFVLLCASFLIGSSSPNGGFALAAGLLITALVWLAGWIQVAILRGLSAYFLMKGLAQQKAINT